MKTYYLQGEGSLLATGSYDGQARIWSKDGKLFETESPQYYSLKAFLHSLISFLLYFVQHVIQLLQTIFCT